MPKYPPVMAHLGIEHQADLIKAVRALTIGGRDLQRSVFWCIEAQRHSVVGNYFLQGAARLLEDFVKARLADGCPADFPYRGIPRCRT